MFADDELFATWWYRVATEQQRSRLRVVAPFFDPVPRDLELLLRGFGVTLVKVWGDEPDSSHGYRGYLTRTMYRIVLGERSDLDEVYEELLGSTPGEIADAEDFGDDGPTNVVPFDRP